MCQNCGRLVPERFLNVWFDQDGSGVCSAERGRFTAANCRAHIEETRRRAISETAMTLDPPDWGDSSNILSYLFGVTDTVPPSQNKRREILGIAMQKLDDCKELMPERCYLDVANELKKVYDIS